MTPTIVAIICVCFAFVAGVCTGAAFVCWFALREVRKTRIELEQNSKL